MPLRIPESALGSRQQQCTAAGALTAAAAAAAALIALACLPAACAESTRTLLTDSFDSPQLNATVWSPFVLGTARVLLPSEGATCGAPINGQGAFILQGAGSSRELQPLLLPPNAAASVQAMRVCDPYSSTQLVLEYSDDEGASWNEAWVATDLPYGALKPYNWTMPPATANKTVLLRFRIPNAAVVLDDWRLEVLWPTPTATQQSNRVLLVDDFEQGINKLIWSPFVYGMARLSGSADNCNQSVYGRNVLAIGPGSFRQLQPFTFAPNAFVSIHAVSAACFYYSSDSPILLEYSDDDEATWKEAWSVLPLFGEWRRYSFSLPFMVETYAHLRFRRDPAYDTTSNILLDRLTLEVVWPQPGRPRPPRPATNRTTFLTDDFEREPWPGFLWSNFAYGTARLGRSYDTCNEALYGSYSFVLGPGSYRQLQPMTVPANATWSVHALLSCDTSGYDVTVVLEYSDDGEATWLEAWSPGPDMPLGEWRRYGFNLPLEKDTFVHLRFRRPDDRATQAVVALDQLSLEVVWPQPPAPSPPRSATNRTTYLMDDFEQGTLTKGINTTIWSNFTYGTARLGNTADTCGQALYGNGIFVLGRGSYRQLQPMTVPANATWSVHVRSACNTFNYAVSVVLEYSDDDEATWRQAWSPGPALPLGEWRRYGFNLPLEKDTFVHLRFRMLPVAGSYAGYVVVALDRLIMEVVWPQPPAPCPTRGQTLILFNDFEPSSNRSSSSAQNTAGGLNIPTWSPSESYSGAVRLGNASDACGLDVYGNGSLVFDKQGGGSLQLQNMTVPADATWSVHVGWSCMTGSRRMELALEYYDPVKGGWWSAWRWSIQDPLHNNEWRRYEFSLPQEVPSDRPVALRFRRLDTSKAGVLLLDNLRVTVPTPAGQSDSCSAAVAPPPPTNPPPPSIPSSPTAGATAPSCAEQPAGPVCLGNTTAVLCPPVQLPAPLHQMRTGAAVSGGDSSGGNASAIVDGGSRGTDTGTIAGDNAQDAQQQQAVAAITLGGMWLAGNGSTVYMCVESVPADRRVALCSGIRTPDLVSAGVGTGIRLEPGQENQLQEVAMAAAAAAAAEDRSAADKEELQPARGSSTAGDSVDGPTGVAADGTESSSSEATAGAIYRLTMGKMAYVAVIDPLGCTATLLSYSEAVGTGEKGGVELVDRLRRAA